MVVKLHLFRGFENPALGITPDTECGHLYEDTGSFAILAFAGEKVGAKREWLQNTGGLVHFDLWGGPLERAKQLFHIASDHELTRDMEEIGRENMNKPEEAT